MGNRFIKTGRRFLALILIGATLLSLSACGGKKGSDPKEIEPVVVKREADPEALRVANGATALALRQYVYARLITERFITADFKALSKDEISIIVNEALEAWKTADLLATSAQEITDQSLEMIEASSVSQTKSSYLSIGNFLNLVPIEAHAAGEPKNFDPKTWAENLTAQYDAIKGGQTIKQLAKQLGTDAKSAYEQLTMAQEIIHSSATADAKMWDALTKAAQATKTICKVTVYVAAAVHTGGGSLSALAGSTMSLGTAGATIVGGADCIVDVAATGSSIILGDKNQVTVGFNDVKDKLAPVSAVVGLVTLNGGELGEQISYVGDSFTDWFFEDKIMGIKMTTEKSGSTTINAQPIDVSGASEEVITTAIEAAKFIAPGSKAKTMAELMGDYQINQQDVLVKLEQLKAKMAVILKEAGQIEENAAPGNAEEAMDALGVSSLSGAYSGTMTMTKVEVVYDSDDVDENGNILSVYRNDGNNDWGDWEGVAADITLEIVQEGDVVRILNQDGGLAFELVYDAASNLWKSSKTHPLGTNLTEGKFSNSEGKTKLRILVTETYENSEVPEGINETVFELTK